MNCKYKIVGQTDWKISSLPELKQIENKITDIS